VNGAADALRRAGEEVNALPDDLRRYVAKPIGTFTWRTIAGEDRPSPHSFGMAIDFQLPAPVHRYWRWDAKGGKDVPAFPREILEDARLGRIMALFERHGFICGGKWRHYDTMHFEYRPELTGGGGEVMGSMGRIEAECRAGRAGRPGLPAPACSGA
jgi:hypothetical protein